MKEFPPRKAVSEIKDYVPGKTVTGAVKLASNENPFGPSPLALEAIAKEAKNLQIYPDQKAIILREALAAKFGVSEGGVICGNGSDDIMQIIGSTYLNPGDEVVIPKNTFSVYELVARLFDGKIVLTDLKDYEVDLQAVAKAVTKTTKLIFLANPNNPTGTSFSQKELDLLLASLPDQAILILDEAYAEFADSPDFPDSIKCIKERKNVIVLRTFSKYYGLAGLRVGYGLGCTELIQPMYKAKMPFNVSRLAQAGALAALGDTTFLEKTYQNNLEGKKYFYAELDKLGLAYKKSEANFIFVDVKRSADELFISLMKLGVILRPLTSFGFPQAIRVSVGTPEQNEKFIQSLRSLL